MNTERDRPLYVDRRDAGVELASHLVRLKGRTDVVVLALPRGGVPVAHEVARALNARLDVLIARKLGVPGRPELAMGAVAPGNVLVLDTEVTGWYRVPQTAIDAVVQAERDEVLRQERTYRDGREAVALSHRAVVIVDDGLATGSTMKAAVQAVRAFEPARIVVAVPVGSPEACRQLASLADEIVCASTPERFVSVGQWYRDFSQTTDEEVRQLLRENLALVPQD